MATYNNAQITELVVWLLEHNERVYCEVKNSNQRVSIAKVNPLANPQKGAEYACFHPHSSLDPRGNLKNAIETLISLCGRKNAYEHLHYLQSSAKIKLGKIQE